METKTKITVAATVKAPVSKVWEFWNGPEHIKQWCNASSDWHAPHAENDLRKDGKFKTTMAAKDGSMSFDFEGVYANVEKYKLIEYTLLDDRTVRVEFTDNAGETGIVETFVAEDTNPEEMQKNGWQAILDNFKSYVEAN
ncbi:SRPBCC family protein [Pedobacter sp. P351]|uniref:SRPBCC family protein n=1 Tax=Pedobacter superstes TaxID=3133441 RepID=UPI0030A0D0CB